MAVLSYALRGMPLIYSGQEAGLKHRLSFFGKDEINWDAPQAAEHFEFYQVLNEIKANPALATDSKITFLTDYMNDNLIVIDRGDNAEYRFIITTNEAYPTMKDAGLDPKSGYNVVFADKYDDETGNLGKWGFVVLKKR